MNTKNTTDNLITQRMRTEFVLTIWMTKVRHLMWLPELNGVYILVEEQDEYSDIEQQPPFGDRKISNIQPQKKGGGCTKPTGTSYNFDKVWSGAPDGRFGKLFLIRDANNLDNKPNSLY